MKKQLLKLTLFAFVMLLSFSTLQAQALWTTNGTYKISTSGLDTNLYLTINDQTGTLEWAEEKDGDDPTQVWTVQDHRTPASTGLMEIFATIPELGNFTLTTTGVEADHPNYTLSVKAGDPLEVEYTAPTGGDTPDDTSDDAPAVYFGDYSGLDQFQRRKAKVNADGLADSAGANPEDGNNALFIKTPWGGNSRYGIIPTAAGEAVQFDGGGIDVIQFHLVEAATASVNTFGVDAFVIINPVSNNQLTIKGATSKVSRLNVYSVLGNTVLSKVIDNQNGDISVNVSALSSGLYIVELNGENGERLTKKIIKQ
ncbi:T9SS type A sorting domain-containing protein [Polaribacter sp.]|uniref:T9SS type A sorting domain-containing protein n=1 Tax=Polaribacter sp. TaxID=1920175 RepID=UPI0025ED0D2F|nr:T9SS type A sorting domain-containing protein [Polaribacter sp.]